MADQAFRRDLFTTHDPEARDATAAHIRRKSLQQVDGCMAAGFHTVCIALAPRTFVLRFCNRFTGGGRLVFKMQLSLKRGAHSQ
eukprot:2089615-Pyramimonas_sp.AAC.1